MTATTITPPALSSRPPSKRAMRREAKRQQELMATVPLRLYGLRKGTVSFITVLCGLFAIFTLAPVVWILINATKNQANIFESFGFWFARPFVLWHNFTNLFKDVEGDGIYIQWWLNTALYAVLGGVGCTILSTLAGYGFARFAFRGAKAVFYLVISALLVPITAISLPLYLVYAKIGLINSLWGIVLPSLVSPVGVYLMRTFIRGSVPRELLDAARIDGAGEVWIFLRVVVPLIIPGMMTVLLISVVGVWNNFFLPLIIFTKENLYPLTVGIANWANRAVSGGDANVFPLILMGCVVTILPLIVLFVVLQRYWKSGLLFGSLTG
jgi:multiple sugar transport system permease protein